MPRQRVRYISSGVCFDPEVMAYIRRLCEEEERPQSYIINKIIREHAARQGIPLPKRMAHDSSDLDREPVQ